MESRVNSMREKLNQKKREQEDANEAISNGFMSVIQKLMIKLEDKVEREEINITDTNDIYKLMIMYSQISEMNGNESGGMGSLPALGGKEKEVLSQFIESTGDVDEEGNEYIDLDKLTEMTPEDVADMITEKEKLMNKQNAETF
ncbi:MAG: hypothetical protein L0L95_11945 [Staphylococcus equorum]|nr:hypothetical protein [Staphylococcus equorum]